jgi:phosphatidylserine decarboxylase
LRNSQLQIMKTLKEFLDDSKIQKVEKANPKKLMESDFNRDPMRAIYHDSDVFYSPADGFIVYSKIVAPDKNVVNVKGEDYTINSLIQEDVKDAKECLIIGIFMCALDVHINRIPTDGFIWHDHLDALKVANLSMRGIEKDILKGLNIDYQKMNYALYNERVKNKIYCPKLCQHYWVIQIADFEVDVIAHFEDSGQYYTQGERFSVVRMGSQVELIIPLINKKIEFTSLVDPKIGWHVEAGIDSLIEINNKVKFMTCR